MLRCTQCFSPHILPSSLPPSPFSVFGFIAVTVCAAVTSTLNRDPDIKPQRARGGSRELNSRRAPKHHFQQVTVKILIVCYHGPPWLLGRQYCKLAPNSSSCQPRVRVTIDTMALTSCDTRRGRSLSTLTGIMSRPPMRVCQRSA